MKGSSEYQPVRDDDRSEQQTNKTNAITAAQAAQNEKVRIGKIVVLYWFVSISMVSKQCRKKDKGRNAPAAILCSKNFSIISSKSLRTSLFLFYSLLPFSLVISSHLVSSQVYLNKSLMSNGSFSVSDAPLFVTWFQCVVTAIICYLCGVSAETLGPKYPFFRQFPLPEYNINTAISVLPLSAIFVGMIVMNNLCLKYVEVSFYNVARSLTIVFNVFMSYFLLSQVSSKKTVYCLSFVILGFFVGSNGELNYSARGTAFGILSSLFVSLNSIYTKKILPHVQDNHWKLTYYNNVNACVLFLPLILMFESEAIMTATSNQMLSPSFWAAMSTAGFFGFSIGIVTVLQIKATSPLSHNMSGTAKAAVQSIMAFYIWGNEPTFAGLLGIALVLGGSLLYTYVKMAENAPTIPMHTNDKTSSNK
jgi:GDP-fucose transporter C1